MTATSLTAKIGARALRTRWLVRAPIWFYRVGLGCVFGSRMLMLRHIGRKIGTARYVVLEVVNRPAPGEYIIVSGFGARAQWYRNVRANPHVRVFTGTTRNKPALAVPMTQDESATALAHYIHDHPAAWEKLRASIEHATGKPVETLPMVRVRVPATTGD
ncbi:nitroreductase family deazaflavin-dependent oxidoreductase [Nocardia brasiliensis]|uniref:nitroreductase family deazaflavin-dependent oxidoreductase n=1 Tax=Nocardia brasiliensis TaxID=37326 RepID=UPI002454B7F7|nr:nitroreductase family deazaflavin-dependent oxidoreductase [Nocardia brasiliensis]